MASTVVAWGATRILFLALFAGSAIVPAVAQAAAADRQTEMNAREAFAAGRFDDALELFAKLYAETLHPVYLRNIGRCHQKMRSPQKAIDSFHDYLAKSKKVSADERAEVEGYIREMEALKTEQAQAAAAEKQAATKAAEPPPPPPPLVTPQPTTPQPALAIEAKSSDQADASPPLYTRWWLWAGIGAVVAGGVVAAILLSGGSSKPNCAADVECK